MGRKRQLDGPGGFPEAASLLSGQGSPTGIHKFAPGNPYLVSVMPLLLNMATACGPAFEKNEKSKHVITQDSWRLVKIEPEVQDIADHFGLDERITGKLQEALNTRPDPGTDLEVMWEILDEARNPPGLTMIKVKEMLEGTFRMGEQKDAGVQSLAEKFKLDERAAYKLSEVLSTKPNKKDVLKALDVHLAASNNPSALVMLKLADLRRDVPLGEVPYGTKGYRDRPYLGNYDRDGRRIGRGEDRTQQQAAGEGPPARGERDKNDSCSPKGRWLLHPVIMQVESSSCPDSRPKAKLADLLSSHAGQVHFLVTFLQQRGSTTSEEFRNRLKKRQPLQVRGYSFSAEVIKEALQVWEQRTFKTTRSSDLPPRAEQSPHNDRADAADAADTKAVSAQSTWTKPHAPHAEPQVPEVGFQKFMDASRRRTLSRSNADAKNADGGCLTRTWIEMAEARRTLGQAEQSDSDSRPGVSHGLCTPEKVAWEAMKRALESSPSPRKCRKMDRESVGSSRSTTDTEASSSVEKPNSRARAEPHPEPSPARQAASCPQDGHVKQMSETVKELKALLRQHSIDFSHCVEKSELQELWRSFSSLQRPSDRARPRLSPSAQPASQQVQEQPRVPARTEAESSRDREAQEEVLRILPLRREAFPSATLWAFAVLGASHDSGSVQRSYRSLMRKLHPDKVKITEGVEKTTALIREAKDLCERSLSNLVVPGPPQSLRYEVLGYEMGRRRYRLCWQPPERNMAAPVSRYLVAALDPAYGKALTITVLEPDYNEELKRFVSVEELNSFVLAEEDLQKMPSLWKQPTAMVQVCAANDAGQSSWSKLEIYIAGAKPSVVRIPSSPGTDSEASSSLASSPGKHFSQDSFNREIQRRSGQDLQQWLQKQLKAHLATWLREQYMPTSGNKKELVERVLDVMGLAAQ